MKTQIIRWFRKVAWMFVVTVTGPPLAGQTPPEVLAWGQMRNGLSNVVAIAAGGSHCLALLAQPTVPTPRLTLTGGLSELEFLAHGAPGISCTLLRAATVTGPWLPVAPVTFTNVVHTLPPPDLTESAQFYRLLRK